MKIKRLVYVCMLFLVILPFVLITDMFPFLRFGMFAEPVKKDQPAEIFYVLYYADKQWKKFDPEQYELQDETFQYLARNYYYRQEGQVLLSKLHRSDVARGEYWRFYRVSFPPGFPEFRDTLLISSL